MAHFRLNKFSGLIPRTHPRLLSDSNAQVAENCNLYSGAIRPWGGLRFTQTIPYNYNPLVDTEVRVRSLYHWGTDPYRVWLTDVTKTMTDDFQVHRVRSPIANNTKDRLITTGRGYSTTRPSWIDRDLIDVVNGAIEDSANFQNPTGAWDLRLPRPSVTPVAAYTSGSPTDPENVEDRTYVITWVRVWNSIEEESAPSDPSNALSVTPGDSITVTFATLTTPLSFYPSSGTPPFKVRLYRTVTSVSGTDYQYVTEQSVGDYTTSTSIVDTVAASALGDVLTTTYFAEPDDELRGIVAMPNGIIAGFVDNEVHFCEPYQPHAWPVSYRLSLQNDVTALGVFGESLVVATDDAPYIITGVHPSAMSMTKLEMSQSCVSWRSMVDMGNFVIYASPDGLVAIGSGVAKVITEDFFTREEWQALNPASIHAVMSDDKYIFWYDATSLGGSTGAYVFDPSEPNAALTSLSDWFQAACNDSLSDATYVVKANPNWPVWIAVYEWNNSQVTGFYDGNLFPNDTIAGGNLTAITPAVSGGVWTLDCTTASTKRVEFKMRHFDTYYKSWNSSKNYRVTLTIDSNTCTSDVTFTIYSGINVDGQITVAAGATGDQTITDPWGENSPYDKTPSYQWDPSWTTSTDATTAGTMYIETTNSAAGGSIVISKITVQEMTPDALTAFTWKSKVFHMDKPVNMAAAQIFGAQTPETPLTFRLYASGDLVYETLVGDERPFRLPGGYLAEEFEFEFEGTTEVSDFHMATTMRELRQS